MDAIEVLMHEHRVIERVLDALESAADALAHGEAVPAQFFRDGAEFAARFADGCHHRKEEGVLFPTMVKHGAPAKGGAIDAMLDEHELGRAYVRRIRENAAQLGTAEQGAATRIVAAVRGYVALLREHIEKEDEMLFPMAAELIPTASQGEVLVAFADVEAADTGATSHAALLALAERLVHESAIGWSAAESSQTPTEIRP